jgi:2-polyprenyl-6-methoxyphenol hydroxylase-like FAD-dependent oxidoreductase
MIRAQETEVLIVGGSLVGLSTAMLLRLHGVSCLVVERHTGTAIHPRAGHFQVGTMEILRSAGLEDSVRRKGEEQYHPDGGINNVESLAGREIASYFPNLNAGVDEFSPTVRLFIDQDDLEPILRARAEDLGAQLRYRVQCSSIEQRADGVSATLLDLDRGNEEAIHAQYLVAADGNRSTIREALGIAMHGHGVLSHSITIYFRSEADLAPLLEGRYQGVNYVTNPVLRGFFRLDRTGNRGFLVVNLVGDISRPEIVAAYPSAPWANVAQGITEPRALELLRAAIGVPDIPVVIEDIATWRAMADSAERYQDERVFLAGDAAHVMPPNGGYGGNAGIHDAHNLAWKLAYVLQGAATPQLLGTYDAERRPIGEVTVEQAYARYVTRVATYLGTDGTQPLIDDFSMELGYRYNSRAVVLEPGQEPALYEHPRESRGRPGSRAPHVVLMRGGAPISSIDLFGRRFVLLAAGAAWQRAAAAAGEATGVPIDSFVVGTRELVDPDGAFPSSYGLTGEGAVLVRPDGIVGWRSADGTAVSERAIREVLERLLCRSPALSTAID